MGTRTTVTSKVFRESQAFEHALFIQTVRPLAEKLFGGREIAAVDIGCGRTWMFASHAALVLGEFGPRAIKLVGIDPFADRPFITPEFEASPLRRNTTFIMRNQALAEDTLEGLRSLSESGFDLVTTFNPDMMTRVFPLMVRLLHPGGLFIAFIAGEMYADNNLKALRSLSGVEVLADCLNPTADNEWNKHLFVAQVKPTDLYGTKSGTA